MRNLTRFSAFVLALALGACSSSDRTIFQSRSDESTVRGPNGERLGVVRPHDQDIARGETETVTVHLKRDNIAGPIMVTIDGLPAGVEAVDAPRSTETDKVEIVLRAMPNADLVSGQRVMVTAEGPNAIRATESFKLTVKEKHASSGIFGNSFAHRDVDDDDVHDD